MVSAPGWYASTHSDCVLASVAYPPSGTAGSTSWGSRLARALPPTISMALFTTSSAGWRRYAMLDDADCGIVRRYDRHGLADQASAALTLESMSDGGREVIKVP